MPKVKFVEKTIFNVEGVNVDFIKDGKNVRDDASLPRNYRILRATKNSANATYLISKLQSEFPGYDFAVYDGEGNKVRGNMLLGNIRDTYLEE